MRARRSLLPAVALFVVALSIVLAPGLWRMCTTIAIETGRITSCSWRHPLLRGLILATGTGGALALAAAGLRGRSE